MIEDRFNPVKMSYEELSGHFEGFVQALERKRPETKGTYQRALREFMRWFPSDKRFRFLVEDIERYKSYLTHIKKLTEVSVSTYLTALRRFCQYLVDVGALERNPAKRVEGNKRPSRHTRELISYEDLDKLFASVDRSTVKGARDYAVMKMMLGCALSEIEIIRADVKDIKRVGNQWVIYVQGKGRDIKDESVVIPPDVKEAIDDYLNKRGEYSPDEPLCLGMGARSYHGRMSTRGVRERVNHYLEIAGIKQGRKRRLTPYSLRHTAAVIMVDNGATAEEVRRRMRLGSLPTAMIYMRQKGKLGQPRKKVGVQQELFP